MAMDGTPTLKDSGERQKFDSGAVRDTEKGKLRPGLLSVLAQARIARIMQLGAEKYAARNWEKGIPMSRLYESAERHRLAYMRGERDEDHIAQWAWNIEAMLHTEEAVKRGILPRELLDLPDYRLRLEHNPVRPWQGGILGAMAGVDVAKKPDYTVQRDCVRVDSEAALRRSMGVNPAVATANMVQLEDALLTRRAEIHRQVDEMFAAAFGLSVPQVGGAS